MNWKQALNYCSALNRTVLDKENNPHWIELDCVRHYDGTKTYYTIPRLCSESPIPFSPEMEPYKKKKNETLS